MKLQPAGANAGNEMLKCSMELAKLMRENNSNYDSGFVLSNRKKMTRGEGKCAGDEKGGNIFI